MATDTVVLVTGATRGIGKGFVRHYLQRAHHIVIAGVRNLEAPEVLSLQQLDVAEGSKVIPVKIDAKSATDANAAAGALTSEHGINHIDIVIANSGVFDPAHHQKIGDMKVEDLEENIQVNTYGVVRLFQATLALLNQAKKPIFLLNSAGGATMGGSRAFAHFPLNSYAASKALANFFVNRIHYEYPTIIAFAVHPGSVVTENRTAAAAKLGVPVEGLSVDESVTSLLGLIDRSSLATTSGTFLNVDGTPIPW